MATGLPIVASNVGGKPELVVDSFTGKLFPPGDGEALSSVLQQYSQIFDLRFQHGARGRKRAVDQFSIEKMVKSYEKVWERVASV